MTKKEKAFIISFKNMTPEWDLLGLNNIEKLPSIRWKLYNLHKMDSRKHQIALGKLKSFLYKDLS